MNYIHGESVRYAAVLFIALFQSQLFAATPEVQTPAPVIYLADNLDEEANLGWCIDTVGRGFGEQIHAHSCKPTGGDVQFDFNTQTGNIESVAFTGKCLTLVDKADPTVPLGLQDCVADLESQRFIFNVESKQLHPSQDESLCLAVAPSSRKAGPFMSRDLVIADCNDTDPKYLQWNVKKS